MNDPLHTPVTPITPQSSVSELVTAMGGTAFQARNLALAADIWRRMLSDQATIFLGLAGAMVPGGMRRLLVYLIENRLVDCLVSTGANLFHDFHETLGRAHWQGTAHADDTALRRLKIDRIYDVYMSDLEFIADEDFITDFATRLDQSHTHTTREFFNRLGRELDSQKAEEGILTAAARAGIPLYCPAFGDSAFGIAVAAGRAQGTNRLQFDIIQDVVEMAHIVDGSVSTGVIYVGGGTPKNFIQQDRKSVV